MSSFRLFAGPLLTLAVAAGMAYIWLGGGPQAYLAINGAALGVALLAIAVAPPLVRNVTLLALTGSAAALLWIPLIADPEVEGINRWIAIGPLRLHSGMLAIPVQMALLPRLGNRTKLAVVTASATALALQPDRASALALLVGLGANAIRYRGRSNTVAAGVALAALVATIMLPDTLAPVAFVENVLRDAWRDNFWIGGVLALALTLAVIVPAVANVEFAAVSAAFAGFAITSLVGAYPTPLIGGGASAILSFGLAVALVPRQTRKPAK